MSADERITRLTKLIDELTTKLATYAETINMQAMANNRLIEHNMKMSNDIDVLRSKLANCHVKSQ